MRQGKNLRFVCHFNLPTDKMKALWHF